MNEQMPTGESQPVMPPQQVQQTQQTSLKPVSDLLKEAWAQFNTHLNILIPIMLLAGIGAYLQIILMFASDNNAANNPLVGALALIALVIYAIGMIWGFTALLNKIHKLDQPMTLGQAYANAKPYIWPVFLVGLIVGILTTIGFILIIIPGIIVAVWLSFSYFIVIDENKRGLEALKASKAYVENYFWPVLGRLLAVSIIVMIVIIIIGILAQMILGVALGSLIQTVISLAITPFVVLYQYNLYKNVKQVKGVNVS